jgi:hypothetical protein
VRPPREGRGFMLKLPLRADDKIEMDESARLLGEQSDLSSASNAATNTAETPLSSDVHKDRTQIATHRSTDASCDAAAAAEKDPPTTLSKGGAGTPLRKDAPPGPGHERAGLISRLCFLWLNPLIQLASHRSLRLSDLWPLDASAGAAALVARFERAWTVQLLKPAGTRSMGRALFSMFWPTFLVTGQANSFNTMLETLSQRH